MISYFSVFSLRPPFFQEHSTFLMRFISVRFIEELALPRPCGGFSIFSFCRPFVFFYSTKFRISAFHPNKTKTVTDTKFFLLFPFFMSTFVDALVGLGWLLGLGHCPAVRALHLCFRQI